jgi:hypothetical protein
VAPKRGTALKSKAQIARALGVSRKSLYLRMKVQPEFAEAMEEAQFAALAWGENMGQAGPKLGSKFNASLYTYEMKNRLREFYTDKVELAHTATATSEPEVPEMSDVELAASPSWCAKRCSNRAAAEQCTQLAW